MSVPFFANRYYPHIF